MTNQSRFAGCIDAMGRARRALGLMATLAGMTLGGALAAQQATPSTSCFEGTFQLVDGQVCTVGATGRAGVTASTVLDANGTPVDHIFRSFEQTGAGASVLFLFDTSIGSQTSQLGNRTGILRENLATARDIVSRLPESVQVGVASFAGTLNLKAPVATDRTAALDALANDAILADGLNTFLFESAIDAVAQLQQAPGQRKVLVIFSDGEPEDSAFTLQEVVSAATNAGVRIAGMASIRANSERGFTQTLERLGEETGGVFFASPVRSGTFDDTAISQLTGLLVGGGTLAIPEDALDARGIAFPLNLTLAYAQGPSQTIPVNLPASLTGLPAQATQGQPSAPPPLGSDGTLGQITGQTQGFADRIRDTIGIPLWPIAVVLALIIALLLFLGLRRREPQRETVAAAPPPSPQPAPRPQPAPQSGPRTAVAAPQTAIASSATRRADGGATKIAGGAAQTRQVAQPIATLIKTATGERLPLYDSEITLGRSDDNGVVFDDTSVSRKHAMLHLSRDGSMRITDLDSTNGVFVNGQRVQSADFGPEDRVALGDAEFTLGIAT